MERVSGIEFCQYVDANILKPLGMHYSSFENNDFLRKYKSKTYSRGREREDLPIRDVPAASLNTNVLNLARFVMMLNNGGRYRNRQILKPETIAHMFSPQNTNVPMDLNLKVGLIWLVSRDSLKYAGRVCYHNGFSLYHKSTLVLLPDHKLAAIVVTNTDTGNRMLGKVSDEMLKLALEIKAGIPPAERPVVRAVTLPKEKLRDFAGDFATLKGLARIRMEKDSLTIRIYGMTFTLTPNDDGFFSASYKLFGFIPIRPEQIRTLRIGVKKINGNRILIMEKDGIQTAVGEEIHRKIEVPPTWLARVGNYRLVKPKGDYNLFEDKLTLQYENGVLVGRVTSNKWDIGTLFLVLDPINEREALIRGLGRSGRETIFFRHKNREEILVFSGYHFKKVN